MVRTYLGNGWVRIPADPVVQDWVGHAVSIANAVLNDPGLSHWYQCEGTWFVGVDVLPNDARGRIGKSGALSDADWARVVADEGPVPPLHKGQLSVVFPGYPRPRAGEGEAAFRYRRTRFAAHVDGLLAVGPNRRRMIREPHAFILGLPLNDAHRDAAPLVLWEGSHRIMRQAFAKALAPYAPADWPEVDLTNAYQAARRTVFDSCEMIKVHARPGEAYVLHRHMLHGIAPWGSDAPAQMAGRMIAYFRPECPGGLQEWLARP